jgi:hypothetical protein
MYEISSVFSFCCFFRFLLSLSFFFSTKEEKEKAPRNALKQQSSVNRWSFHQLSELLGRPILDLRRVRRKRVSTPCRRVDVSPNRQPRLTCVHQVDLVSISAQSGPRRDRRPHRQRWRTSESDHLATRNRATEQCFDALGRRNMAKNPVDFDELRAVVVIVVDGFVVGGATASSASATSSCRAGTKQGRVDRVEPRRGCARCRTD